MLLQSRRFHLLIVQGPPGWGKSSITADALRRLGIDFHAVGSYSTPLALFNTLVENDDATIILDDTSGLFQHQQAMAILNAATWASASTIAGRRVTWTSATEMASASEVIFRGKLIVLTNHLPNTPAASAFKTRALNYTLEVDAGSAAALLVEAAQSEAHFPETELAQQVASFLGNYATEFGPHRINLRTLEMGYDFASLQPQRWQELLMMALPKGSHSDLVRELESSGLSVEQQMGRFPGSVNTVKSGTNPRVKCQSYSFTQRLLNSRVPP